MHALKNVTDQLSGQNLTELSNKVDAVQLTVAKLEVAQKNITVTLENVLQQMDSNLRNNVLTNSSSSGHHH